MTFHAHKKQRPSGELERQTLRKHLRSAAEIAATGLKPCGLSSSAYLAGLLHDMGKYTDTFQLYLEHGDQSKRGSVIHTFQGCRFLLERSMAQRTHTRH